MKIKAKTTQKEFVPIEVTLIIESENELNYIHRMTLNDITVPGDVAGGYPDDEEEPCDDVDLYETVASFLTNLRLALSNYL